MKYLTLCETTCIMCWRARHSALSGKVQAMFLLQSLSYDTVDRHVCWRVQEVSSEIQERNLDKDRSHQCSYRSSIIPSCPSSSYAHMLELYGGKHAPVWKTDLPIVDLKNQLVLASMLV